MIPLGKLNEQILGIGALLLLAIGCAIVLWPFLSALLWAAVICFATWPIYRRCEWALGGRRGLAAALMTLLVALVLVAPFVRRSAEGATEVGEVFAKLAKEQAQNNVETFQALTRTVDWSQVAQIHGDFLRASVERAAEFTKRYFEVAQAVVASTVSTANEQARKTA